MLMYDNPNQIVLKNSFDDVNDYYPVMMIIQYENHLNENLNRSKKNFFCLKREMCG